MGAFQTAVAGDIVSAALDFYMKGPALAQTIQDKPLLAWLKSGKKTFPSGKGAIKENVQIVYMSDSAGNFAGYSEDDALTFANAANILQSSYDWKEVQMGLAITFTELKKDGISVSDRGKTSEHTGVMVSRITSLLENRLDDLMESWSRNNNKMFWLDGTQDAKQVPGITSILPFAPGSNAAGTVGGISRVTYPSWRHRLNLGLVPSGDLQTVIQAIRTDVIQLRRFGGKPNKWLAGSAYLAGIRLELQAKGLYTQSGFSDSSSTNIGMGYINVPEIGRCEYDPTLDDLALSKFAYIMDGKHIKWRPMEGEEDKMFDPERPYQYMVFLKTLTNTGAITANQLNCHEVMSVV